MATLEQALYDLVGPGRAPDTLSMSEYAPEFGAEEARRGMLVRQQLGQRRPSVNIRQSGLSGGDVRDLIRSGLAVSRASGDIASSGRAQRIADYERAGAKRDAERHAAHMATMAQQDRLRANVAGAIGRGLQGVRSFVESPEIQAKINAKARDKQAIREMVAAQPKQLTGGMGEAALRDMINAPTYQLGSPDPYIPDTLEGLIDFDPGSGVRRTSPVGSTERMLSNFSFGIPSLVENP